MKTHKITLDGIEIIKPEALDMPHTQVKEYTECCGPGRSMGEKVIPDRLFGLKISHCCLIHDEMFDRSDATWADFHHSNNVFAINLVNTVNAKGSWIPFVNMFRHHLAWHYKKWVDSDAGAYCFWRLKRKQGLWADKGTSELKVVQK